MHDTSLQNQQAIYTVSQLNNEVKSLLENTYFNILLEGEVSNFVCHGSGHWYFSLKDDSAQIQCAMFRMHNNKTKFMPENGDHILAQAKVSIYPDRGNYQLIIHRMEDVGEGVLQKRFEKLKATLSHEGLFDQRHKKNLPAYPQTIGIITSETGAAIQDILSVLNRRYPLAKLIVYPCIVQGTLAAKSIIHALSQANNNAECDVLILARGGGSIEDLWSFNEEPVVRAVFNSAIPIVTGIGHETDFTICDFVSDARAATPSAAAETASPDQAEIRLYLHNQHKYLTYLMRAKLEEKQKLLIQLEKRLNTQDPRQLITAQMQKIHLLSQQLKQSMHHRLEKNKSYIASLASQLNALSPLAVLSRGYSILTKNSLPIHSTKEVAIGDKLKARVSDGEIECDVLDIKEKS